MARCNVDGVTRFRACCIVLAYWGFIIPALVVINVTKFTREAHGTIAPEQVVFREVRSDVVNDTVGSVFTRSARARSVRARCVGDVDEFIRKRQSS